MGVKVEETPVDILNRTDISIPTVTHRSRDNEKEDELREETSASKAKISHRNKIITSLFAGALAGATAKTIIAPLDRTKINFQTSSDKKYSFRGALRFLIRSARNEGFLMLWRGNSATITRIMPYAAVQYASHEQWKHFLHPTDPRHLPPIKRYIAGSLAGVTASSCTYPLDLARARMAVTQSCMYSSLTQVFARMYREEGLATLFRGYIPTMLGVIPYAGTSFFTYETLKKKYLENLQEDRDPIALERLCFGAVAGLLGQTSSYPLDIVRRRMQTAGVKGKANEYTSVWKTLQIVYTHEGLKGGLYKGLSMNWIKGPIAVGVSFSTFETIQTHLRKLPFFHVDGPS